MRKRTFIATLMIAGVLVVTGFLGLRNRGTETSYRFVTVERGDVISTVTATGNLEAVTTVQVGTQVSGSVAEIRADFNDHVARDQVIAVIDTTLLAASVRESRANLAQSEAQLAQARREYSRSEGLHERDLVSEADFNTAQYQRDVAEAQIQGARVNLERAERNLAYATIRSPISGVVIERNVDVGQTVAASLSAPQLFLIAEDLSRLQILASVDESDIGKIRAGQDVNFTVQAYANRTFTGAVHQVRLQSVSSENVVNYMVVISVENPDGTLLPGMTATVDFVVDTAPDAFHVPNAALRFTPTENMREQIRQDLAGTDRGGEGRPDRGAVGGDSLVASGRAATSARSRPADAAVLFHLDESGTLRAVRVRTGITNGSSTVITGEGLAEGLQVIAGVSTTSGAVAGTSPFQNGGTSPGGGPPRRGGF